jgi:hypothetical protein
MRGRIELEFRCPACQSTKLEPVRRVILQTDNQMIPASGHDGETDFLCNGCGLVPLLPVPVNPVSGQPLGNYGFKTNPVEPFSGFEPDMTKFKRFMFLRFPPGSG